MLRALLPTMYLNSHFRYALRFLNIHTIALMVQHPYIHMYHIATREHYWVICYNWDMWQTVLKTHYYYILLKLFKERLPLHYNPESVGYKR